MQVLRYNNYTYRYLEPSKSVYAIVRYPDNRKRSIKYSSFYSIPFQPSRDNDTCRNVLITCVCKNQANYYKQQLMQDHVHDRECLYEIEEYQLRDITYYSTKMSMPLIVIISSQCELTDSFEDGGITHDIFYTNKLHDASSFL